MSQQGRLRDIAVETISGNSGGPISADSSGNLNILGNNAQGINITGNPATHTLTVAGIDATTTQKGVLETATDAEAVARASSTVALVPTNIGPALASPPAIGGTLPAAGTFTALNLTEAANSRMGRSTLVGGTVTVANTSVATNSEIFLSIQELGTVAAPKAIAVTARVAATSFTITSEDGTDTSIVSWLIINPV